MVFVNSMSDLFHKDVPDEYIARVFKAMARAPQHTFQLLTKRHGRMRSLLSSPKWPELLTATLGWPRDLDPERPLDNLWLGVSVENQHWETIRGDALRETPAAVRFYSAEPLLGGIAANLKGIDWVIIGGESGPGARPMQLDWARSLRDQCTSASVPFLFKQWGEWTTDGTLSTGYLSDARERHGELVDDGKFPALPWHRLYRRVGKKVAGRELDGRTWDEYPTTAAVDAS
jgi:protein gp37